MTEAVTDALGILTDITTGVDFDLPDVDLSDPVYALPNAGGIDSPVARIDNEDLTTKSVTGTGTFDVLMAALRVHLQKEFEANRLTGEQYAKVYTALTEGAMAQAVQFLLAREQNYWQAVTAQQQALTAQVALVTSRVQLAAAKIELESLKMQANTNKANYALTVMKLATENVANDTAQYQLDNLLPEQKNQILATISKLTVETDVATKQGEQIEAQTLGITKDNEVKNFNLTEILPEQKNQLLAAITKTTAETAVVNKQGSQLDAQTIGVEKDNATKDYNLTYILPEQKKLVQEQMESVRAQTMDTRSDGVTSVTGIMGKQKDLYAQQITSYVRDAEIKAAKIFSDAWITMKTIDEGLLPPENFNNASLNAILATLKTNNELTS